MGLDSARARPTAKRTKRSSSKIPIYQTIPQSLSIQKQGTKVIQAGSYCSGSDPLPPSIAIHYLRYQSAGRTFISH